MYEDGNEEDGIEIRDGRAAALTQTPGQAHNPVCNIVGLARIRPPAINEQTVSGRHVRNRRKLDIENSPVSSLDVLGVVKCAPWQLREGLAVRSDTLSLHLEATLLGHRSIPADDQCQSKSVRRGVGAASTHM
jgi:hypothetical protein